MDKSLLDIISYEDITTLYQPIVNLITGEIMGYEALSRGPEWSRFYSPLELIHEAERQGLTEQLEFVMRKKAVENIGNLGKGQKLFINVNPSIMKKDHTDHDKAKKFMAKHNVNPNQVVFELTERSVIEDYDLFNDILNEYKQNNYRIAIDDVGSGYSGLRTIGETKPHYVKIDMELVRNIDTDTFKEALINALLNFSVTTNIRLIAEGIETEAELSKLIEMGIHYGQGYYLKRPEKELTPLRPDLVETIKNTNNLHHDSNLFTDQQVMIGPIANTTCMIQSKVLCQNVKSHFEDNSCEGLCVVENNIPSGIIMRESLLYMLSSTYGISLYSKKEINHIMDTDFLMVDYHTSITEVSRKAMARDRNKTYDIIIVTKNGEFYGVVSITVLLRHLVTVETQNAKELNPLTRLPGNLIINRVLNDILMYQQNCSICYIDFDNFKPYNDIYGFDSGDQFIKTVADIILQEIKSAQPYSSFVGHIGGDDFIFVTEISRERTMEVCQKIIQRFEDIKPTLYSEEDLNRGFITSTDRNGQMRQFDLTTLSISGLSNHSNAFASVEELSKHMSQLKKEAKDIRGNAIILR